MQLIGFLKPAIVFWSCFTIKCPLKNVKQKLMCKSKYFCLTGHFTHMKTQFSALHDKIYAYEIEIAHTHITKKFV